MMESAGGRFEEAGAAIRKADDEHERPPFVPQQSNASLRSMRKQSTFQRGRKSIFAEAAGAVARKTACNLNTFNRQRRTKLNEEDFFAEGAHSLTNNDLFPGGMELRSRNLTFRTIGRAPVAAPVHQARLTPVRLMSPTPPLPDVVHHDAANGEDTSVATVHPPRSFSRQCCHIMREQDKVMPFDVISIYLGCDFFKPCCFGFVRALILAGGPQAWRGVSVPPHVNVYTEGDTGHAMYIIARGTAALVDGNGKSKQEFGISDYFGEIQALGVTTLRLETIRAKTSLQVFVITQHTLTKLLKRTQAEEDAILGYASQPGDTRKSVKKVPAKKGAYADERRYFESESVRRYKDYTGRRSHHKRIKKVASGKVAAEARAKAITESVTGAVDSFEATQARERLFNKVVSSLRTDLRRGYMMPADPAAEDRLQRSMLATPRKKNGGPNEAELPMDLTLLAPEIADDDEEAICNDREEPLDPHLLPPLAWLSPVQKHGILRQLKHQNRAHSGRVGTAPTRGRVVASDKPAEGQCDGTKTLSCGMMGQTSMASITTCTGGDEASTFGSDLMSG